jgi:hypothetical protein
MRSVVLMGTSHKHQLAGNTSEVAFRDFVEQICDVFKVRAIAEETSTEMADYAFGLRKKSFIDPVDCGDGFVIRLTLVVRFN